MRERRLRRRLLIEKVGTAPEPSEVLMELIAASWGVWNQVMVEIYHSVLDGFTIPFVWAVDIVRPFYKGKGDITSSICYGATKLLFSFTLFPTIVMTM